MVTESTRLHAHRGVAGPGIMGPRATSARATRPAPSAVHPGVTRVATWLALGVLGWAVVASVLVAGFRIFV